MKTYVYFEDTRGRYYGKVQHTPTTFSELSALANYEIKQEGLPKEDGTPAFYVVTVFSYKNKKG